MGWFRRNDAGDCDDYYRGDAPVLMPGVDGEAPTAYVSGSPAPPHARPGAAERNVRRVGLGCFVIVAFFVLLSITGVALAIFAVLRSGETGLLLTTPDAAVGAVDVPLAVRYDDTDLTITIGGAQSEPGAGWGSPAVAATPNLVIAATIQPNSTTADWTTIPFVYWTFTPSDGSPTLSLNIISGFEPSIVTATLRPGQAESGYLAFETASTSGTLNLTDGYGDPPVATWELTATPAVPVPSTARPRSRPSPAEVAPISGWRSTLRSAPGRWKCGIMPAGR